MLLCKLAASKVQGAAAGKGGKALQGNLDPAVLLAGPEATARAARELMARVPARGHVMNLGHGVSPDVPIESVEALIAAVHGEGGQA